MSDKESSSNEVQGSTLSREDAPERVQTLADYVEEIGDNVFDVRGIEDGSNTRWIIACYRDRKKYNIIQNTGASGFSIRYRFSLTERISRVLVAADESSGDNEASEGEEKSVLTSVEDVKEAANSEEEVRITIDDSLPKQDEAERIIKSIDRQTLETFGLNLFQEVSDPGVEARLEQIDGYFEGFTIKRKIFPNDSGFSLTEFNHSVQAVMSMSTFANNIVARALGPTLEDIDELDVESEWP